MELSEVITFLEALPADAVARPAFGAPDSWRGVYSEVAFAPAEQSTAAEMLAHARAALGATFTGWKGGEYMMHGYTSCHVAWPGHYGGDGDALSESRLRAMFGFPCPKCGHRIHPEADQ